MRIDQIGSNFGRRFAAALASAEVRRWTGPHVSSFGLHLVFVEERTPARDPGLDAIRDLVLREWRSERRRAIAEERYQALRTNYDVTVTLPPAQTTSVTSKNSIGK
jgi:parvulin-like peptidyl-prolyl isomerase